jgi:hypothetical protein
MNDDARLSQLIAVERAEQRSQNAVEQGYQTLQRALAANAPALPIAHGSLKLGLSLAGKTMVGSGLIAFAVTTGGLGLHAALQEPAIAPPSAPVSARASAVTSATAPLVIAELPARELPVEVTSVPVRSTVSPVASSTFAEELRLLKAAKQELDSGRGLMAKVLLDQHQQLYPKGVFRAERERLRARLPSAQGARENFPDAPGTK